MSLDRYSTPTYVASKVSHKRKWINLRDAGYNVISTWINFPDDPEDVLGLVNFHNLWTACITEAATCKRLIVYHEPGDQLRGALVEAGAALAHGVPVLLVGSPDGTWMNHPLVFKCANLEEALDSVPKT